VSSETSAVEALYGAAFFAGIEEGARPSAEAMAPLLLDLFAPRSILDVGGGGGHWAAAFMARGLDDVLTVDGPWVPLAARAVPPDRFLEHDLTKPLKLERTFDLALCLEAAEHLPAAAAPGLVRALTEAAPVVVFSAALPGQGGEGHVNEQPPSYWAGLFAASDYVCLPDLRRQVWDNQAIKVWYRQNLLCFVRRSTLARWSPRLGAPSEESGALLDVAHPELLVQHKQRGDRLEAYAQRLEEEAAALRDDVAAVRWTLAERQAELDATLDRRMGRAWRRVRHRLGGRRGGPGRGHIAGGRRPTG
jgi:SAM-dependent methyltransferase